MKGFCLIVLATALVVKCAVATQPWRRCELDTECGSGETCSPVPIGGERYCLVSKPVVPHFTCPVNFTYNECCDDSDCGKGHGGVCVTAPTVPYCGGAAPPPWNNCNYDSCLNSTGCGATASCVPRGFYNLIVNVCVPGDGCRSHDDCVDGTGGQCTFFAVNSWCPLLTNVACTYSSSICRKNADCPDQQVCSWVAPGGRTACVDPIGPPPKA